MFHAVALTGRFIVEVLSFAIAAPVMILPRRFWSARSRHAGVRFVLASLPPLLLVLLVWAYHFMAHVEAHPTALPKHILGMPGARFVDYLHHIRASITGVLVQAVFMRDGLITIAGKTSAEVTVLLVGAMLWLELLAVSTLFLGPVHLLMLRPVWQVRLRNLTQQLAAPALRAWDALWRDIADKQHTWFLGTNTQSGAPVFVDLQQQRTTWILGGLDRRSAGVPLMNELRAAIQAGSPVLFIDSVANPGLADELRNFAHAAHRATAFRQVQITEANCEAFQLDLVAIQTQQQILYVGIPMHQKSLELQQTATRILRTLADAARLPESLEKDAVVVAIQDGREMPSQAMSALTQETGLRLLVAQQACDTDHLAQLVSSLRVRDKHLVICLAPARSLDASNIAHALAHVSMRLKKDKDTTRPAITTDMMQSLRRHQAHVMVNAKLNPSVIRLSVGRPSKKAAKTTSAPTS